MGIAIGRRIARGFTLVELLIVVIIVAMLAAIVVPQFSNATVDARESALDANLAAMRSAIELYQAQHLGKYPGAVATSGGASCAGTAGNGPANDPQAFMDALLMYSNAAGQTCTVGDANYKFGPYMRKGIPSEPITGKGAAKADIVIATTGAPLNPAAATGGWTYDTKSGQIVMNSNENDSKGKAFSTH